MINPTMATTTTAGTPRASQCRMECGASLRTRTCSMNTALYQCVEQVTWLSLFLKCPIRMSCDLFICQALPWSPLLFPRAQLLL